MKCTSLLASIGFLSFLATARALPAKRDGAISDVEVLNFALTLEHLENVFYKVHLDRFSQEDFAQAGFPDWVRNRFEQVNSHEATHVEFLTTALGAAGAPAVKQCEYNFPVTNAKEFVMFAAALETTGASAYSGAASLISNKDYLTAAASILSTEARHSSWIQSAALKTNPWSGPFETPLSGDHVFTIASAFIKSCPSTNFKLPFKAFPQLSIPASARPGQKVTLTFDAPADKQLYVAFLNDNDAVFAPVNGKEVEIPSGLKGTVFAILTNNKSADDASTVAGPALLMFPEDSRGVVQ